MEYCSNASNPATCQPSLPNGFSFNNPFTTPGITAYLIAYDYTTGVPIDVTSTGMNPNTYKGLTVSGFITQTGGDYLGTDPVIYYWYLPTLTGPQTYSIQATATNIAGTSKPHTFSLYTYFPIPLDPPTFVSAVPDATTPSKTADITVGNVINPAGTPYAYNYWICSQLGNGYGTSNPCTAPTLAELNNFGVPLDTVVYAPPKQYTSTGNGTFEFTDPYNALTPNSQYIAAVATLNTQGNPVNGLAGLIPSSSFWTTPLVPATPTATTVDQNHISVTFTPPSGNPSGQTYYVGYEASGGSQYTAGLDSAGSPISLGGLVAGTQYSIKVCAHSIDLSNPDANFAYCSAAVSAWTKFTAPTIIQWDKTKTTSSVVDLQVTFPQAPHCAQLTYTGGIGSPVTLGPQSAGTTDITLPLQPNMEISAISIVDGGGDCSVNDKTLSPPSNMLSIAATYPAAPGTPTVTPLSQISMQVSFSGSTNGLSYYVKVLNSGGTWLWDGPVGGLFVTINGLAAGTSYLFKSCTYSIDQSDFHQDDPTTESYACSAAQSGTTLFNPPTIFIDPSKATGGPPASFHAKISFGLQTPTCVAIFYTPLGGSGVSESAPGNTNPEEWDVTTQVHPDSQYNNAYAAIGKGDCSPSDSSRALSTPAINNVITPPAPPLSTGPTFLSNTTTSITAQYNFDSSNPTTTQNELQHWTAPTSGDCSTVPPPGQIGSTTPKAISVASSDTITGLSIGSSYCVRTLTKSTYNSPAWDQVSAAVLMSTQFNPPGTVLADNDPSLATSGAFGVTIQLNDNNGPQYAELDFSPVSGGTTNHVMLTLSNCTTNSSGDLTCAVPLGTASPTLPTPFSNSAFNNLFARFTQTSSYNASDPDPFSTPSPAQVAWTMPAPPAQAPTPVSADSKRIFADFPMASNPSNTNYVLQAGVGGSFDSLITSTSTIQQGNTPPGTTVPVMVGGLQGGQIYGIRVRVISGYGVSFDTFSAVTLTDTQFSLPAGTIDMTPGDQSFLNIPIIVLPKQQDATLPPPYVEVAATYDSQVSTTAATPTSGMTYANGQFTFNAPFQPSNAAFTNVQIRVGGSSSDTDPSWSAWAQVSGTAYTAPQAPSPPFGPPTVTATTITSSVTYGGNSTMTEYLVLASPDPSNFDPAQNPDVRMASFQPPTESGIQSVTVTGLTGGLSYYLEACAVSVTGSPSPNACSAPSAAVTTDIGPGVATYIGISSVTMQWTVPDLTDALSVEAQAVGPTGAPNGIPQPLASPTSPVQLTVTNLSQANTSYTLSLYKETSASPSTWIPYPGSSSTVILYAAPPPAPEVYFTGTTKFNIMLNVTLPADANNASDSVYGIKVSQDGGATWNYMKGDGTLTGTTTYMTLAQWANEQLTLGPVPIATTYSVETVVLEKTSGQEVASPVTVKESQGGDVTATFSLPAGGVALDNYIFGIPQGGPFNATFSTDIDTSALASHASLIPLQNPSSPIALQLASYDPDSQTASLVPKSPLSPAALYKLTVSSGIPDSLDLGVSTQSFSQIFVTGIGANQGATVTSPYDAIQANQVLVGPGVFPSGGIAILRTSFVNPAGSYSMAESVVDNSIQSALGLRSISRVEVLFYNPVNGQPSLGGVTSAKLTLSAQDSGGAAAPGVGMTAGLDPTSFKIYSVQPQGLVALQDSNNNNGVVTATIQNSGVYILAGTLTTDLSSAYAYPVPFKASQNQTIKFASLAADSTIKVYTIMGELVAQLHNDNNEVLLQWPVTNLKGEPVASGVYIYQIKNGFSEKRGKLIVIR